MPGRHEDLIERWKADTFDISQANKPQSMFAITKSYIWHYSEKEASDKEAQSFITAHADWKAEAFKLCLPLEDGAL